ncbi:MAG TPA: M48 family metallopeptidase [Longimicrobiaceae bacterium]|nr:M48 family metallopeptidase [Longimicrobiaceae bacterium]
MTDAAFSSRHILTDIDPRSWEHPADRAALNALRKLPGFDEVLKKLFGFFGEKPIRLAFQANAVRVSPTQFPRVHRLHEKALAVLDAPAPYPVYISQTPFVNAGAYGMEKPFIILNSAMLILLDDDELEFILGHEIGHIMSGHVLYTTMMVILVRLAQTGFPLVGIAARAILIGLMEWYRKAELSSDRAGVLAVQQPEVGMRAMLKLAGGGEANETDLPEFIRQADEYRATGDLADQVFKVLNLLGADHPFPVLRVAELRDWFQSGAYERIIGGEYQRRGDAQRPYREDVAAAAKAYAQSARETFGTAGETARRMVDSFRTGFR